MAVLEDQATRSLVRKQHAGDASQNQRLGKSQKHRSDQREAN